MRHLIAYDIADPRRLRKAHRYLIQHTIPLQNSVFLHIGSSDQARQCFETLCKMLNAKQDNLRCYPLPNSSIIHSLGKPALPEGIILGGVGKL